MDNNELEEGEYIEDEEEQQKNTLRKNESEKRFNRTSNEKDKSKNSRIFRSAFNDLGDSRRSSEESRKRKQNCEEEEELLLRQQLLKSMASQERRPNTQQAKKTGQVMQQKSQSTLADNSIPSTSTNSNVSIIQNATNSGPKDDIATLTNTLLVAQHQYTKMMKRKQNIQQSLASCEADLEMKGEEITKLIERISNAWNHQLHDAVHQTKIEKHEIKLNDGNGKVVEQNPIQTREVSSQTTLTNVNSSKSQETTPVVKENANKILKENTMIVEHELEEGQISGEENAGEVAERNVDTEDNNCEQIDDLGKNNEKEMEKGEDGNGPRERITNRSQEFDPFLMSIRSYRLSPLFPQNLIIHPAVSNRLNPYIPLCPYQLTGRCADRQCPFQHEEDYSLNEQQIIEEIIGYWPKICPNGMQPSQYAANLLANGPFDQVVGFLISRMPDSIRIGHQPLFQRGAEKQIPLEDGQVEYESIMNKALTPGNMITLRM